MQRGRESLAHDWGEIIGPALQRDEVREIMINCDGTVFFDTEPDGMQAVTRLQPPVTERIIRTVASLGGMCLDPAAPVVSGVLPQDGSRFEGLLPPLVPGPCLCVRRHTARNLTSADLRRRGRLSAAEADFLLQAVLNRRSLLICGPTGSGKTTLLNALINDLARERPQERLICIEDTPELTLRNPNALALRTNARADAGVLLRSALRLRPDRLIVGEVRGAEALDLIDALATGHRGGMATLHAGSVHQALRRLTLLVSRHPRAPRAIEPLLAAGLDLIVILPGGGLPGLSGVAAVSSTATGMPEWRQINPAVVTAGAA